MRRWLCSAIVLVLALATQPTAAKNKKLDDGPRWPKVAADEGPSWPRLPNDTPYPTDPPPPALRDTAPTPSATLSAMPSVRQASRENDATHSIRPALRDLDVASGTARWPSLPPQPQPVQPLPFRVEAGVRYWYSSGEMFFGFANNSPGFGDPTSTLDWRGMTAHSGELFARVDHKPTGLFVKGLLGMGSLYGGRMIDRDFFTSQFVFSDTTSDIKGDNFKFAMIDVGWAYSPSGGMRLGVFVGYHYWTEKAVAYGLRCNINDIFGCGQGGVMIDYGTPVISYEPTLHAVRLGVEARYTFAKRWSVSGEIALVPYSKVQNKDSHLLRQSPSDLGPAPNIISDSRGGLGVEAELLVNYALTPNIEVGAGVRYWGIAARQGDVTFGPNFSNPTPLNQFDLQRFGVLLEAKGKF